MPSIVFSIFHDQQVYSSQTKLAVFKPHGLSLDEFILDFLKAYYIPPYKMLKVKCSAIE